MCVRINEARYDNTVLQIDNLNTTLDDLLNRLVSLPSDVRDLVTLKDHAIDEVGRLFLCVRRREDASIDEDASSCHCNHDV